MEKKAIQYFDIDQEMERPQLGREFQTKLQSLGRKLVSSLYMLVRTVKLHAADNKVFEKPLEDLKDNINTIIAVDDRVTLFRAEDSIYMNNMLLRLDKGSKDNVSYLFDQLEAHELGGFAIQKEISIEELRNFIHIFSKENAGKAEEDGVEGKKLMSMQLIKFQKIAEKLSGEDIDDIKIDRKKYALTVYSRGIYYFKKFVESIQGRNAKVPISRAIRIIQDLIEIVLRGDLHFLGLTTMKSKEEYLYYHSMNVALLSIVLGKELGLDRTQLRDLGLSGLFHDIGMAYINPHIINKPGKLDPTEQLEVDRHSLLGVQSLLELRGLSAQSIHRIIVAYENHINYGTVRRDSNGRPVKLLSRNDLSFYARVVAICDSFDALTSTRPYRPAYKPAKALEIMKKDVGDKYDPVLFKIFSKVLNIGEHQKFRSRLPKPPPQ